MTLQGDAANCAWADYRKNYGVSPFQPYRVQEHKAFHAGWDAAKGELQRGYYLVPLADLPEVKEGDGFIEAGTGMFSQYAKIEVLERVIREHVALIRHLQSRESEAAVLEARRDELITPESKAAIEALIDTENRAATAEAEVARLTKEAGE